MLDIVTDLPHLHKPQVVWQLKIQHNIQNNA